MYNRLINIPKKFAFPYSMQFLKTDCGRYLTREYGCSTVNLDFKNVREIDSSAIGAIVMCHKLAKCNQIDLCILNASGHILNTLITANIDKLVKVVD